MKTPAFAFTLETAAWSFCDACHKPHRVILGEGEQFWVVTPAEAARLAQAGYEYAPRPL